MAQVQDLFHETCCWSLYNTAYHRKLSHACMEGTIGNRELVLLATESCLELGIWELQVTASLPVDNRAVCTGNRKTL